MAHKHRKGDRTPLSSLRVKLTSTVPTNDIAIGDLIALVSDYAVPAHAFTWDTDEATTRAGFVTAFVGISASRSRANTTDARDLAIQVNTQGYYEFDVASATYEVGSLIGPGKASGNALTEKCKAVTGSGEAIGVVVQRGTTVTTVLAALVNGVITRKAIRNNP